MMKNPKEIILRYLREILEGGITEALLVPNESDKEKKRIIHSVPRILISLTGEREVEYLSLTGYKKEMKGPKTAQYCGKDGYMYSQSFTPSQGVSLCFYGDFIRCMHIDYNGKDRPPTSRDTFYHTNSPLSRSGFDLLKVLDGLAEKESYPAAGKSLLEALLHIAIEDIATSDEKKIRPFSPSYQRWRDMENYISAHFKEDLTRDGIAEAFGVSTSHVSHLFQKFGGKDFTSTLSDRRLEYAAMLLKQTNLTVDEIGEQCSFQYTSYFIRRFKKKYQITPSAFRKTILSR